MGARSKVKQMPADETTKPDEVKLKQNDANKKNQKANYEESWSCSKCTLINSTKTQVCILCGASYLNSKEPLKEAEIVASESTPTIFDGIREGNALLNDNEGDEEEKMPQKGNVLDRVVQFTAMQMYATDPDRPASVMASTPRDSMNVEDEAEMRPFSAMNSRSEIFAPTPIVVHRVENGGLRNQEQKRKSVLEKEDQAEIIAKWKKEHEEKEKARRDFFQQPKAAQNKVLETQAALLEEAQRNRQKQENNNTKKSQPTNGIPLPIMNSQQTLLEEQTALLEEAHRKMQKQQDNNDKKNQPTNGIPLPIINTQPIPNVPAGSKPQKSSQKNSENTNSNAYKNDANIPAKRAKDTQNPSQSNNAIKKEQESTTKMIDPRSLRKISNISYISRFDPKKTPSSFIPNREGSSPPSETEASPETTFDPVDDLTRTAMRQKRLEYFESLNSPPETLVKQSTFERKDSAVKQAIELEEMNRSSVSEIDEVDNDVTPVVTPVVKAKVDHDKISNMTKSKKKKNNISNIVINNGIKDDTKKLSPHEVVTPTNERKSDIQELARKTSGKKNSKGINRDHELSVTREIVTPLVTHDLGHYDIPICPPRKVPDSFFQQRGMIHPLKQMPRKMSQDSVTSDRVTDRIKRISTTSRKDSSTSSSTDYETVSVRDGKGTKKDGKRQNRNSANVMKNCQNVTPSSKNASNNNRKSIARDQNEHDRATPGVTRNRKGSLHDIQNRDIVTPDVTRNRKGSSHDQHNRDIVTPENRERKSSSRNQRERDIVTPLSFNRENTVTPSFHRDRFTPIFTRENTATPCFTCENVVSPNFTTRENTVTPSFHRDVFTPVGYTRDIVTPVTPRFEIRGLNMSGPAAVNLDPPQPQRPSRNKNRKSQSIDTPEPPQITPRLSRKSQSFDNSSAGSQQPPQIIPRALPKLELVQKPSIRKVDEIDDLVTKQVHNNAPIKKIPAPTKPSPQVNMDSKTPKKLQKSGAIPKSSKATKATKSNNKG